MANKHPETDRELLTRHAFATDDKLGIRQRTHELYTVPKIDFTNWVLDRIDWRGDEWVLDLGAGPGLYFGPVKARIPQGRHFAGDFSFGMVKRQRENRFAHASKLAVLDAQTLPFADDSFDVVLANHMLYFVPEIDRAIAEIQRVLKPGGVLLAATNSAHTMPELNTLYRRALLLLTNFQYHEEEPSPTGSRFCLENGCAILGRHFYAVARYDLPSALVFPAASPVIDYLESMRDLREGQLPEGISWERFMDVMRQQVVRLAEFSGKLVVKKLSGALVATEAGAFAADYVSRLRQSRAG